MKIKFTKDEGAKSPVRATPGSAGFDLFANEEKIINPGGQELIKTGIYMSIPNGYVGIIKPRSGLAVRNGIDIMAGVIDSDYRGEIKVLLWNTSDDFFVVKRHMRIAQLLIIPIIDADLEEVNILDVTDRGSGGFGSTGVI